MGATKRTPILSAGILALTAILSLPTPGRTGEREVAGMITEIHLGEGRADVRSAETELWRPAMPLLTLRAGDAVTTTQDAWVVIVLTGGRGSVRVDEANAPFSVTALLVDRSPLSKGLKILEASFNFLSTTRDLPLGTLGTRGGMKPPAILTPRNGQVLPDSLVFEWRGSRSSLVTVRIVGPGGLVFERTNLAGARFEYPRTAPPLLAGVRYRFQLLPASPSPAQEVWFELVNPADAQTILWLDSLQPQKAEQVQARQRKQHNPTGQEQLARNQIRLQNQVGRAQILHRDGQNDEAQHDFNAHQPTAAFGELLQISREERQ